MISVAEAKKIISTHSPTLPPVNISLAEAGGLTLAENVHSLVDIPNFHQSSMDGYAFRYQDLQSYKTLSIHGEFAAGINAPAEIEAGTAVRIFTGAPLPHGADTVVMQEKTKVQNGRLAIDDPNLTPGTNVRQRGAEIRSGQSALEKGSVLNPAAIGFLAGVGITSIAVHPLPAIAIITTGNELQKPGQPLAFGQVYDSNTYLLQAAFHQLNIKQVHSYVAEDNLEALVHTLNAALAGCDVVCLTGGVSVGDYDFVAAAAEKTGVEKLFHKLKQKPGKPLYFGKKKNKLVFGLPGNPASVLTCFYEYVEPALRKMAGQPSSLQLVHAPIATSFKKPAGLTHFLKGYYDGRSVTLLPAQESFRLSSFAKANCLVVVDEDTTSCEPGEIVEVHLLP